ncbi:ArsR/SmtB family transcription factor [Halapricum hydrolyticum]|uniref:Helix-turn-helix domain-containing protein n=1 Tax=Halapricum hydrolyticum TaxID=2979991 RepID=A0AAE3LHP9_9EURY|nr:helix-turn-helix domain-containing protein [Halapricum hydrolyticum]MCU4717959.1 helix-turn-helix domain-containing protein [Halapricum hydrolyticum]MCU4727124.1 helix-turn-helix domain-containing protein [Halapricum hydrolyticum]
MSIQRLLPSRLDPAPPEDPRVYSLDAEDTRDALNALSADTARTILSRLYDQPSSPTELREEVGTSLQNVHYHLENLQSAGLIREVGTRYSEKGNEMSVYAPASEAVVFVAGRDDSESRIERALARALGAVGLLAGGSLAFGAAVERWLAPEPGSAEPSGPDIMADAPQTAAEVVNAIDPALAFFLGGAFVLAMVAGWQLLRSR